MLLDRNDGKHWSATDIADLKNCLEGGGTIYDAAMFLCRAGTYAEVRQKAKELGFDFSEDGVHVVPRK
jgi:hypothetical protein